MVSHMTTSAPSNPPSSAYSAVVIAARRSGSRSKRSRNRLSHVGLLKPARSPCTWCDRPLGPYAQHERRIVVEEERGDVIVVDPQQDLWTLLGEPRRQRREVLEDRRPYRVVALVAVVREANGRRVRGGDAADDACHV